MKTSLKPGAIYPVILSVPEKDRQLSGREKVVNLSRLARCALKMSEKRSGLELGELLKGENGAPMPWEGVYWSLSHKNEYAGGVVAREKIGLDIEKIKPRATGLYRKTADENEWNLFGSTDPVRRFFRCWTAKEAVIKAAGTGIQDLLKCRIEKVHDDRHLIMHFQNRDWLVEHFFFDDHIASVVKISQTVNWVMTEEEKSFISR